MGQLTTHVLDTALGKPGESLQVRLYFLDEDGSRTLMRETLTNKDGRTDQPLLNAGDFRPGTFELVFRVKEYFAVKSSQLMVSTPPFFDEITIRVTLTDEKERYHVPLLFSPWAYSTYRGS